MINIKGALCLAKRAIYRRVIAITNCYRTAVGNVFDLITTDTEIPFQSGGAWQTALIQDRNSKSTLRQR